MFIFIDYENKLLLQYRYVIILFNIYFFVITIINSYEKIVKVIINKLSELHIHPILVVHFFSIPTFFIFKIFCMTGCIIIVHENGINH